MAKSVLFTVTTDVIYDQRMQRICNALATNGYNISIIGHQKTNSLPIPSKNIFKIKRLKTISKKGMVFYAEYNVRLFFYLLAKGKSNIYCAIDLDTILPVLLAGKIKRKKLVFDAHEYFEEMEEVVNRPFVKKVWETIGKWAIPKFETHYTVGSFLASIFEKKYNRKFEVVRNVQVKSQTEPTKQAKGTKTLIYVGKVNMGRGIEQLLDCVPLFPADVTVKICGDGDMYPKIKKRVAESDILSQKVTLTGYLPPNALNIEIQKAWAGYLMLTNAGKSYYYSLANKFFDYVMAGKPQICINFPEYQTLMKQHEVGILTDMTQQEIIKSIEKLNDDAYYNYLSQQTLAARERWNWEEEQKLLLDIYKRI